MLINSPNISGSLNVSGNTVITGSLTTSIAALGTAATTFLTSNNGTIRSRTAAQTLSDIGGQASGSYLTISSATGSYVTVATDQSITGVKTFTKDIIVNGINIGLGAGSIDTNTRVGTAALLSNTTGFFNVALGRNASTSNTTGNSNTSLGYNALYSANVSVENTAVGSSALSGILGALSAHNVGVGSQAGKFITDGSSLSIATNSIFIGQNTRALANNQTNQIVIGHNAIGNGSNSVTIGNSSITENYFTGNVRSTALRIAGSGSADPTFFKNTNGTSATIPNHNLLGFNNSNDIFVTTELNGGFILAFNNSTSNKTYTLQDADGTLAFTSQIPTVAGAYIPLTGGAITGSLIVTEGITGDLTGSATTASYVEYTDVVNKPTLVSSSVQIKGYNVFATTGSNQFNGSQSITGSLTVTGQVIAQTLNVQEVTSSIVFSSGSNRFGNNSGNTHRFTGSLQVSGSSHYLLGNVGVGVNNPQTKLHINGALTFTEVGYNTTFKHSISNSHSNGSNPNNYLGFNISDGSGTTAERMRIDGSGNVGIGTISPSSRLNVAGAKTNSSDLSNSANQLAVTDTTATAAGVGGRISFLGSYTATPDYIALGAVEVLKVNANNYGSAGWNNASMRFIVGNNDNDANAGRMLERMRITTDGEVLIGATGNNLGKLDVTVSPSSYTPALGLGFLTNSAEGNSVGISFKTKISLGAGIYENARIAAITESVTASVYGTLAFYTMNATTLSERMRINLSGNVGIGTDSPSGRLHVFNSSGGTTASNYLQIEGAIANNSNYPGISLKGGTLATSYPSITLTNGGLALTLNSGIATAYNNPAQISLNNGVIFFATALNSSLVERMQINSTGAIIHEGLNVKKTKSGGTSVSFVINLAATGYWAPGYATIRVAASRGGLQEHYAAMYFLRITYYQGSSSTAVYNIGGDTGSASVVVTSALVSSQSQITITVSDVGASTDYLTADIDATFQTGIASIT